VFLNAYLFFELSAIRTIREQPLLVISSPRKNDNTGLIKLSRELGASLEPR